METALSITWAIVGLMCGIAALGAAGALVDWAKAQQEIAKAQKERAQAMHDANRIELGWKPVYRPIEWREGD